MPTQRAQWATFALALTLAGMLGWNLYQAEVERRPAQTPGATIEIAPTTPDSTVTSLWSTPSSPANGQTSP